MLVCRAVARPLTWLLMQALTACAVSPRPASSDQASPCGAESLGRVPNARVAERATRAVRIPAVKRRLHAAFLAAVVLVGCVGSPEGSPSPSTPSASTGAISGQFPPGCEPIDLRGPDGQPTDLTGAWTGGQPYAGFFASFTTEGMWIRQVGDCIWAALMDEEFRSDPDYVGDFELPGGNVGTLRGQITSDFVIEGELVAIRFGSPLAPTIFVPIRLLIEFEPDGRIKLREDRVPGVVGPRCYAFPGGDPYCGDPVILYRVEDLPAPVQSPP